MPTPSGEEFGLGECPNKHTYDSSFVGPSWDELLDLLVDEKITRMAILFCGKARSDGSIGGTGFGIVTNRDVQRVALAHWTPGQGKLSDITQDETNTPRFARELLGLNVTPQHVTGIIVRKLN